MHTRQCTPLPLPSVMPGMPERCPVTIPLLPPEVQPWLPRMGQSPRIAPCLLIAAMRPCSSLSKKKTHYPPLFSGFPQIISAQVCGCLWSVGEGSSCQGGGILQRSSSSHSEDGWGCVSHHVAVLSLAVDSNVLCR